MNWYVVEVDDLGGGFSIQKLEDERGATYYRCCHGNICRYCEDRYIADMYIKQMREARSTAHRAGG